MKIRLLILIFIFSALINQCTSKNVQQRIYDYEVIFTAQQIHNLDSLYQDHEKKTTNQFALITTPNYGQDTSIESYALHIFNRLGIGRKDINNGVLIVLSKSNRQVRISTGFGTEKVLTNLYAKGIIDSIMIPEFKNDRYYEGILRGSKAIISFLERPENRIK